MAEETTQRQSRNVIDYTWEDYETLKRFLTETGKILPRKLTRLSAHEQRHITKLIKQARNMLLLK